MSEHLTLIVDTEAKHREAVKRHGERTRRRVERKKHRRCFWTQPYGHFYLPLPESSLWGACVGCGKRKWIGGDI